MNKCPYEPYSLDLVLLIQAPFLIRVIVRWSCWNLDVGELSSAF